MNTPGDGPTRTTAPTTASSADWARVKLEFARLVELPPGSRPAALARLKGDTSLHDEVASLLRAAEEADRLDAESASRTGGLSAGSSPAPTSGARPALGRLGPYTLRRLLGEGTYGEVFLADQHEPLQRKVAIKLLKLHANTPRGGTLAGVATEVLRRFALERASLARMDHPSIARVLDAGESPDGRPYFVMELVSGAPITTFADAHKLSLRDRLRLMILVCRAVHHAHQKGIVHRDIKPGNILVAMVDHTPLPKVIDFGIAKAIADDGEGSLATEVLNPRSRPGDRAPIGTPMYMSPEQGAGSGDVDTRSDVYSLGAVLHELTTGFPPVMAWNLNRSSRPAASSQSARTAEPRHTTHTARAGHAAQTGDAADAPPAARTPHRPAHAGPMAQEAAWIASKALSVPPGDRYASAEDMALDLERALARRAVKAAPRSRTYVLRCALRRHWVTASLTGLLALVLIAATVTSTNLAIRAREAERRATDENRATQGLAEFLSRDIIDMAAPAGNTPSVDPAKRTLLDVVLEATRRLDAASAPGGRFHGEPLVQARIRESLASSLLQYSRLDEAERQSTLAANLLSQALGPEHPRTLSARLQQAVTLREAGRAEEARDVVMPVIDSATRTLGPDHYVTLRARHTLALLHYWPLNQPAQAAAEFTALIDLFARTDGPQSHSVFTARYNLGRTLIETGDLDGARDALQQVLAHWTRVYGPRHPTTIACRVNLARVEVRQGKLRDAEAAFATLADDSAAVLGEYSFTTIGVLSQLAQARTELGRLDEALPLIDRAEAAAVATFSPTHSERMGVRHSRALWLLKSGRPDEARAIYEQMIGLCERTHGQTSREAELARQLRRAAGIAPSPGNPPRDDPSPESLPQQPPADSHRRSDDSDNDNPPAPPR